MLLRVLSIAVLLASFAYLSADELRTLSGKAASGALKSIDDANIVLETKDGPLSTPLAQVLALDLLPIKGIAADSKYTDVRLIDDTVLHCKNVRFGGKQATLTLLSDTSLKLPLASITSLVRGAENAGLRKKFEALAHQKIRSDRIVILREGELNPVEGTLGDIDAEGKSISFKRDGAEAISLPIERLHGMVFFRPEGPTESPICKVHDREGNLVTVAKIAFKDNSWRLTTTFGTELSLPGDAVAKLDFNMGKLTYLSDLEPARVLERSAIGLVVKHRKDTNLDGEPILLDRRYGKGLSMHAHTELEYDLAGKFKDLKGTLGVDVRTGSESQPLVTIFCDGEKRFSETITAKAVRPISLNVKDVATLKIVISSRNELDLHDHVTFAEARVSQ
ncbi:MAG: NPCBM/NEW2 domain-containing protein [Planctomycetota bacterium]|jgi:hypothetical protein